MQRPPGRGTCVIASPVRGQLLLQGGRWLVACDERHVILFGLHAVAAAHTLRELGPAGLSRPSIVGPVELEPGRCGVGFVFVLVVSAVGFADGAPPRSGELCGNGLHDGSMWA